MAQPHRARVTDVPGLASRRAAADILDAVLRRHRPLDEQIDGTEAHPMLGTLSERDRAFVRKLLGTTLRRLGTLRQLLARVLDRGIPGDAPRLEVILLLGATQILWLDVPDHAAVDLSVRLAQADRRASRYPGLVNAVLRRIARDRAALLADLGDAAIDTPEWLMARWRASYGSETATAIAEAHRYEPPLDLTVKGDPDLWAQRLRGHVVPTGTVTPKARGGSKMPPQRSQCACSATCAAGVSPIFARRQGAKLPSLRQRAPASQPSIVRPRGSPGFPRTWRASGLRRRPWWRTLPTGAGKPSTRSSSMRHAHRPAPSDATRTFHGSNMRAISRRSRRFRGDCSTAPRR
jgi:16S rRNA (cytosine967-C5)-methyltransferase